MVAGVGKKAILPRWESFQYPGYPNIKSDVVNEPFYPNYHPTERLSIRFSIVEGNSTTHWIQPSQSFNQAFSSFPSLLKSGEISYLKALDC